MWQIVKKIICVFGLLFCSFSAVYAANSKNITLNIQGTGQPAFVQGFKEALVIEAKAAGYDVSDNMSAAKYSIKFNVEFDQSAQRSKFTVSLVKVVDSSVIVSMEYLFADEEEMLLYSQLVFFMLMANLPDNETAGSEVVNDDWRNKWLYINPYYKHTFMYLKLQPTGLYNGLSVYQGPLSAPTYVIPLDNKIIPMPGIGLGIEFQFLDFMSFEANALLSMEQVMTDEKLFDDVFENIDDAIIGNLLLTARLNFPLKFVRNLVIEPYGLFAYTLRFPKKLETFTEDTSPFAFGGGVQFGVKAGNKGMLFFDFSCVYYYGVTKKYNPLYYYPIERPLGLKPEEIYYKHIDFGFGIGYKFGFFDRKR